MAQDLNACRKDVAHVVEAVTVAETALGVAEQALAMAEDAVTVTAKGVSMAGATCAEDNAALERLEEEIARAQDNEEQLWLQAREARQSLKAKESRGAVL